MELSNDPPGPGGRTELSWRRDSWKAATLWFLGQVSAIMLCVQALAKS